MRRGGAGGGALERQVYELIAQVERTHWWYCARREVLHAVVTAELRAAPGLDSALDLGCGTGANLPVVARTGTPIGVDVSDVALAFARRQEGYAALAKGDAEALPFGDGAFGWVFALDILEHLDDGAAAAEIFRVLRPAGRAVITVPAFPALWGTQDDVAHHRRRYTKRTFLALLRRAGFRVARLTYINSALFLPIFAARRVIRALGLRIASENTLHPGWANPLLRRIFAAEARIVPHVPLPFGVSLLCVAVRPPARDGG